MGVGGKEKGAWVLSGVEFNVRIPAQLLPWDSTVNPRGGKRPCWVWESGMEMGHPRGH